MGASDISASPTAYRVKRLAHLDLPGGGQVVVRGTHAFVGHMDAPHGTTILDVSNPRSPRVVAEIKLGDQHSHSHKVRVVGDLMYTNIERPSRRFAAKSMRIVQVRAELKKELDREPANEEVAARLKVQPSAVAQLDAWSRTGFPDAGFKIWDIADRAQPKLITHVKTGGVGVHRFDVDENHAYISTGMEGYGGNILVNFDVRNPARVAEVSRWWLPGQHLAGGETPEGPSDSWHLHHAMRCGDELWAGCFNAGVRVIDVADIARPRTVGSFNYHPPFNDPTHTVLRIPFPVAGREIALAIDEAHGHHRGQISAGLWILNVADLSNIQLIGHFQVSELDSPWARKGRFGAHQFQEHMHEPLAFCAWFSAGLRVVEFSDPLAPQEVGWFIPEPCGGFASPQTNDVDVDERGLVYTIDRNCGFDILEFQRS